MNKKNELARKIYNQKSIDKMDRKIKLLGEETKIETIRFLNLRLFTSLIVFLVLLYLSNFGYIIAPIITIIYYLLYAYLTVDRRIKKRKIELESEAIHFFEVLTLSLETGRNLEEAFGVTIKNVNSKLSTEFKEVIKEVKLGKSLTEAMNDKQKNIPSEAINNIILTLNQADLFGNSIIKTMHNQIDYLREKKKLEIKAEISKVPIKISIISVLFFVPLILLIILAPVVLSYFG